MSIEEIQLKQFVFIKFLKQITNDSSWNFKQEYSTNDKDTKVVTVQEQAGEKVVFYGNIEPLFNYYMVNIYGASIREEKELSTLLGYQIGINHYIDLEIDGVQQKWQVMIKQFSNFQAIEFIDIRRVGYSSTFQVIVNKVWEE